MGAPPALTPNDGEASMKAAMTVRPAAPRAATMAAAAADAAGLPNAAGQTEAPPRRIGRESPNELARGYRGTAPANVDQLRDRILMMDAVAQSGMQQVASIARLTLKAMETRDPYSHLHDVQQALEAISRTADWCAADINREASEVGCEYVDDDERARNAAELTALQEMAERTVNLLP
jgi:hypothetical protein